MLRLALIFCCMALSAEAMPIAVRSGEHADFSRLVIMLPKEADWKLDPTAEGYRLETDVDEAQFQIEDVFRLIPRSRVVEIKDDAKASGLLFTTTEGVKIRSFPLRLGGLVLDFYDAPAQAVEETVAPHAVTSTSRNLQPVPIGAAHLDLYWQGLIDTPPTNAPEEQDHTPNEPFLAEAPLSVPQIEQVDERVSAVEERLRQELSRAAAQGLVEVDTTKLHKPAVPTEQGMVDAAPEVTHEQSASAHKTNDQIAFKSKTSIDQANHSARSATDPTESGLRCASDSLFDLGGWIGDGDASDQIGKGRRAVMGEFDKPNQDEVIKLARTYLAFGFGAESRMLLNDMGAPGEARDALFYLADLFDELPDAHQSPFAQMTGCDGNVAAWALLGADPLPPKEDVNFAAVRRSYQGLSPQLRQTIGPDLVARLIALGAPDIARAIRPALSRITEQDRSALHMVDAQLILEKGGADADHSLADVVAQDGLHAAQALLLLIDDKLSRGQAIESKTTQNARALAFELRGTPLSYRLLRAATLGHASVGEFDAAVDLLAGWPVQAEAELRMNTRDEMVRLLVKVPDDGKFLRALFAHMETVQRSAMQADLRFGLADRLINLGFASTAKQFLAQAKSPNEQDRLLLGKAALASQDAAAALTHFAGIAGPEVEALRAQALALIGEHGSAQKAYSKANEPKDAIREAWRGGNWDFVRENADGTERDFANTFAPASRTTATRPEPSGPLSQAEELIAASQKEREIFEKLLGSFAVTDANTAQKPVQSEAVPTN